MVENTLLIKTKPRPILSTNPVPVKKKKKKKKENRSEIRTISNKKYPRKASGSDNTITYVFNGLTMCFDNTTEPTILDQAAPGFIESKSCTSKRDTATIAENAKALQRGSDTTTLDKNIKALQRGNADKCASKTIIDS